MINFNISEIVTFYSYVKRNLPATRHKSKFWHSFPYLNMCKLHWVQKVLLIYLSFLFLLGIGSTKQGWLFNLNLDYWFVTYMLSKRLHYDVVLTSLSCPSIQLKAKEVTSGLRLKHFQSQENLVQQTHTLWRSVSLSTKCLFVQSCILIQEKLFNLWYT